MPIFSRDYAIRSVGPQRHSSEKFPTMRDTDISPLASIEAIAGGFAGGETGRFNLSRAEGKRNQSVGEYVARNSSGVRTGRLDLGKCRGLREIRQVTFARKAE